MYGPGAPLDLPRTKDGRPILTREDLDRYDPAPQRSGARLRYYCPIHGGDHQRSFALDPDTGLYMCHGCQASGQLREFWPDAPARTAARRAPSLEERGRHTLEAQQRTQAVRAEAMAQDAPRAAAAFLGRLGGFQEALRTPGNPGAAYLRARGLDPDIAADLGAGYAPPGAWPGDDGRRVGRIVYPLADPAGGAVVSALGRLCIDRDPAWSPVQQDTFKGVKQRKLPGCPAGVWPWAAFARAIAERRPLVLVEGPADALAVMRFGTYRPTVALCGTSAGMISPDVLRQVCAVVLALDGDGAGAAATRALRATCAAAGVPARTLPAGWLGPGKDLAELVAADIYDAADPEAVRPYIEAARTIRDAVVDLTPEGSPVYVPPPPIDDDDWITL